MSDIKIKLEHTECSVTNTVSGNNAVSSKSEIDQVEYLFSLIDALPNEVQAKALEKLKQKLEGGKNQTHKLKQNPKRSCTKNKKSPKRKKQYEDDNVQIIDLGECIKNEIPEPNSDPDDPTYNSSFENENDEDPSYKKKKTSKPKSKNRLKKIVKKDFTCDECEMQFTKPSSLKIHKRMHTGERPFICDICDRSFTQKGALEYHIKRHKGIKPHKCTLCDYRSISKVEIVRHSTVHSGEKNFTCEICGKSFTTISILKYHIKCVHNTKTFQSCELCDFTTHTPEIMKRHVTVRHTNNEKMECPICKEVINQKGSFLIHMRKHTGEKPYKCKTCEKTFSSNSTLSTHLRTHREGEYLCEICKKKFRTRSHLKRHELVHTGKKPFACHLCSYTCNCKGNITKHVQTVHNMPNFTFRDKSIKGEGNPNRDPIAVSKGAELAQELVQNFAAKAGRDLTVDDLINLNSEEKQEENKPKLTKLKKKCKKESIEVNNDQEGQDIMKEFVVTNMTEEDDIRIVDQNSSAKEISSAWDLITSRTKIANADGDLVNIVNVEDLQQFAVEIGSDIIELPIDKEEGGKHVKMYIIEVREEST